MDFARPSRRQFLRGAGLSTAAAITIGPAVLPISKLLAAAGAQEAQAPTAPELAAFAESVELAAMTIYGPLQLRLSKGPGVAAAGLYARHHAEHAKAVGPLAADKRTGKPNTPLSETLQDRLSRANSEDDVLEIAYDLESGLASTYLFIIGSTTDGPLLKVCSSILPVDAQHAVVLGGLVGKSVKDLTAPDKDGLGYETQDKHFDPATFPTVETTTTSTVAGKKA
jgi:hypothetical protein